MNTILLLMNILLICVECLSLYLFTACFFTSDHKKIKIVISVCLLSMSNTLGYAIAAGNFVFKLIVTVFINAVWTNRIFHAKAIKCVISALFFCSFMFLGDSVFLMCIAMVIRQDVQVYMGNPYFYYLVCYVIKMIELAGIIILRLCIRGKSNSQAATWKDWFRTLIFPIASIILSMIFIQVYTQAESTALLVLIGSVVLIITDVLAILLLNYLEEQQRKVHDYSILRHDLKMERDNIDAWMNAYANQRQQTHEYQNQLALLRGFAEQEAPRGELIQYLDHLLQTDLSASLFVQTGRRVVDVILNQKHSIAQSKGITFRVQLDNLTNFALPDDALVIVLSNLIDNAIEASEQISSQKNRKILLKMQALPEESILYIENTTSLPVQIENNQVVTTKKNPIEHGYGLKNIDAVLRQVDAVYALSYRESDHVFCFSVQIIP